MPPDMKQSLSRPKVFGRCFCEGVHKRPQFQVHQKNLAPNLLTPPSCNQEVINMADTWLPVCLLTVHLLSNGIISASRFSSANPRLGMEVRYGQYSFVSHKKMIQLRELFSVWVAQEKAIFHDMNTPPVTCWSERRCMAAKKTFNGAAMPARFVAN
ncbi:hypothetical protein BD779DRAFT_347870 [Infundibulicybe gibba]|nr:hypothetical protein BD779DRAFT_347870 [Infundibulicybe gibba]